MMLEMVVHAMGGDREAREPVRVRRARALEGSISGAVHACSAMERTRTKTLKNVRYEPNQRR